MAADNSPPRIQPIIITAFIAVLTLVGLKFVFDSYYLYMFEAEEYRKIGSVEPTELRALRAAEKKSFSVAPVPLERAIDLVTKGRGDPMPVGAGGDITPQPSTDTAPLIGWASLGRTLPTSATTAASAAPSAAPMGSAPATTVSSAAPAASGSAMPRPAASASAPPPVPAASAKAAPAASNAAPPAKPTPPAPAPSAKP
jgi:hypothetical protein